MPRMIAEIEACIPALRRFAIALLHNQLEADDLVHNCLVSAFERLPKFGNGADPRVHMLTLVYGMAGKQPRPTNPRAVTEPGVVGALARLPFDQRCVLLLTAVEELSYASTAQVMGSSVEAVVQTLSRARAALRRYDGDAVPTAPRSLEDVAAPMALRRVK